MVCMKRGTAACAERKNFAFLFPFKIKIQSFKNVKIFSTI